MNIMAFCKDYNAATQDKIGTIIPVEITVFEVRLLGLLVFWSICQAGSLCWRPNFFRRLTKL